MAIQIESGMAWPFIMMRVSSRWLDQLKCVLVSLPTPAGIFDDVKCPEARPGVSHAGFTWWSDPIVKDMQAHILL
jgi:hypothetical protein